MLFSIFFSVGKYIYILPFVVEGTTEKNYMSCIADVLNSHLVIEEQTETIVEQFYDMFKVLRKMSTFVRVKCSFLKKITSGCSKGSLNMVSESDSQGIF